MRTIVIGCNHRTAPLDVRERLAFDRRDTIKALRQLRRQFPCCEGVILSTCNRTELYVARPMHGHPRIDEAIAFLGAAREIGAHEFGHSIYHYEDMESLRHLFRVVSSLDSMVLGESEILAQAKDAVAVAREEGMAGRHLEAIFQRAFAVAKNVRAKTGISGGKTSVGGVAVEFARQIFARFDDKTVLMIGAGQIGEVTLQHLVELQPKHVVLTNRTASRAQAVLQRVVVPSGVPGEVVPFEEMLEQLARADIVLSSTGAPEPILSKAALETLPSKRHYRPLLIVDIAVPRDVAADVGELENVFVYNIDDLQSVAEANVAARQKQIAECQALIEGHVTEFLAARRTRDVGPLVAALQRRFSDVGAQELARVLPKLTHVSHNDRKLLEQMVHRMTQKLLHPPTTALRDQSASGNVRAYAEMLRHLFGLHDEE
jgi:glutamyl-tRNA reductase